MNQIFASNFEMLCENVVCNLINLMEAEGLSQLQVGEDTQLGQGTISKLLNGQMHVTLYYACCIGMAYEVLLDELLGED